MDRYLQLPHYSGLPETGTRAGIFLVTFALIVKEAQPPPRSSHLLQAGIHGYHSQYTGFALCKTQTCCTVAPLGRLHCVHLCPYTHLCVYVYIYVCVCVCVF